MNILHKNVRQSSPNCCLTEAPECGESLDLSEEDDDGLAGHQRENEVIHLAHILTKHIHLVLLSQKLLETWNPSPIHGWHWPPVVQ